MTLKEKIMAAINKNPDQPATAKDIAEAVGCEHKHATRALARLVEDGELFSKPDPLFRRQRLFGKVPGSPLIPISFPLASHDPRNLYKHIYKEIRNTEKEKEILSLNRFPDREKFNAFVEAYLTPSERKVIESAPDEVKEVFAIFLERLQNPVIRTPVLKAPVIDPPHGSTPHPDGATEPSPAQPPVPTPEAEEEIPPLMLKVKQNMEKIALKKPKPAKPETARQRERRKALEREIAVKEERIASTPFHPHVRYFGMTPIERDYEFAKAYVKVMPRMYPDWRVAASHKFALVSPTHFRESKKFREEVWKARCEADLITARYEDYVMAICQYYMWRSERESKVNKPVLGHMGGDVHATEAKNRIDDWSPRGQVFITREDIQFTGNADFLLAENYETTTMEQRELAHQFYQDVVYDELVRAARLTTHASGKPVWNLFNAAIKYGLVPRKWAEDPDTQALLPTIEGYRFEEPRSFDATIFRPVRY